MTAQMHRLYHYVGLNHEGYLPEFLTITDGKIHDITVARELNLPPGSRVVADKAYNNYAWYNRLTNRGVFFVARIKNNADYRSKSITSDHIIELSDAVTAKILADLYKSRRQVELFFKWIKQNLTVKSFVGTSKNAVLTQVWIAMCVYLLLTSSKFQSKLSQCLQQILRILQLNLFEKRDLMALIRGDSIKSGLPEQHQVTLF